MVICLERGADLHMAQLMPPPLTVSCFSKIQIGFTFLVPAHPGSPGKRAVKRARACVCVIFVCFIVYFIVHAAFVRTKLMMMMMMMIKRRLCAAAGVSCRARRQARHTRTFISTSPILSLMSVTVARRALQSCFDLVASASCLVAALRISSSCSRQPFVIGTRTAQTVCYTTAVFSAISHYSEASNHKSNNPKRKLKTSDQLKSEFISHIL